MQFNGNHPTSEDRPYDWRWYLLIALPLVVCGCSNDGRVDLSGNVTWRGQPVPAGMVAFSPDVAAGNQGPTGMALIENGRYDTSAKGGRPVTPGPLLVSIQGFDGQAGDEEHRHGKRMFVTAEVAVTAPENSGTLDLVVPENAEAVH